MSNIPADQATEQAPSHTLPALPALDPTAGRAWSAAAPRLAKWAADRAVIRRERYGGYYATTEKTDDGGERGVVRLVTRPSKGPAENALTGDVLRRHFQASEPRDVIGLHPLTAAAPHTGRWIGLDIDNHAHLDAAAERNARYVAHLHRKLSALGFRPLTATWGGGGYHVLVYFDRDVPGDVLHAFSAWVVSDATAFGYYHEVKGDPMSGLPEFFPVKPVPSKKGNAPWLRLVGRYKSRDVWAVVFDGSTWLQGRAAVEHVLSLTGDDPAMIPAEAAPKPEPKAEKKPKKEPRFTPGPKLRVTSDGGDVFAAYNRSVTLDFVVGLHKQYGDHPVFSESATRVEFSRFGAKDDKHRFNVEVRDGVPVTYNFSPKAGIPPNDGLSPSEVRCFYETGRCDTATLREFAKKLKEELGWKARVEPEPAAAAGAAPTSDDPPKASPYTDGGYTAIPGLGTYHCEFTLDKDTGKPKVAKQTKLANFIARIVGETVTDDGVERAREFNILVEHPRRGPAAAKVPVEKFTGLDWVVEQLGTAYVIHAGRGTKDQLRHAIQELSGDDTPTTTAYAHTGWREVGGRWVYLHAGGAIGAAPGAVTVRLDSAVAGYLLPDPPAGEELRAAVRASLGLLDGLAPDTVVFPLLSAVYRAPLGDTDFGLWLTGPTGSQKSELAALAQQHYGAAMSRTRLPGNWSSTDNALEALAFTTKDAVFVVDDFAPPATRADLDKLYRTVDRLVRGQGNGAGRQRMRADGTFRPHKPPRGLVVTSAEDVPRGHSIIARLSVAAVAKGRVDLARLSACQRDAADGKYAASLAGFLDWLAPQYATVTAAVAAERVQLRDQFVGKFPHARTPDVVANQLVGLRQFLRFAEAVGAVTAEVRAALWTRGQAAFRAVADDQAAHQRDADPVAQFPAALAAVVSSGRGYIAGADGKEPSAPPGPTALGWEMREGKGTFDPQTTFHPRGRKLGWAVDDTLMLDPDSTYAAVADFAREKGQAYPLSQQTLLRRLKEAGLVVRSEGDRTTYKATVEGVRRSLIHLRLSAVFPLEDLASRFPRPGFPGGADEPGRGNGANPHAKPGFDPSVPEVPVSWTEERAGTRRDELADYDAIAH